MTKIARLSGLFCGALVCAAACTSTPSPTPAATLVSTLARTPTATSRPSPTSTGTGLAPSPTLTPTASPTFGATLNLAPRALGSLGKGMITGVFRSPDGKLILYAVGPHLHFVDALSLAEQGTVEVEGYSISNVFFSADGRLAAVVPAGGQIPVIDLADRHVITKMDGGEIGVDVKFTPDDHYAVSAISWIVSGGSETNIEIWDLKKGQLVTTLAAPGSGADRTLSAPALRECFLNHLGANLSIRRMLAT